MKEKIIYKEYIPGQMLFEGEVASILNVSKTPVREAFNRLQHEGLIEVIPYKGYFVTTLTLEDIKDLFEMRIVLEGFAAQQAAERGGEQEINELIQLSKKQLDLHSLTVKKEFLKINADFHIHIGKLSGNRVIAAQIESCINRLQRVLFQDMMESTITRMEAEHLELAEAIRMRNGTEAKNYAFKHLVDALHRILNYKI